VRRDEGKKIFGGVGKWELTEKSKGEREEKRVQEGNVGKEF
jgi:hypothetical protein